MSPAVSPAKWRLVKVAAFCFMWTAATGTAFIPALILSPYFALIGLVACAPLLQWAVLALWTRCERPVGWWALVSIAGAALIGWPLLQGTSWLLTHMPPLANARSVAVDSFVNGAAWLLFVLLITLAQWVIFHRIFPYTIWSQGMWLSAATVLAAAGPVLNSAFGQPDDLLSNGIVWSLTYGVFTGLVVGAVLNDFLRSRRATRVGFGLLACSVVAILGALGVSIALH